MLFYNSVYNNIIYIVVKNVIYQFWEQFALLWPDWQIAPRPSPAVYACSGAAADGRGQAGHSNRQLSVMIRRVAGRTTAEMREGRKSCEKSSCCCFVRRSIGVDRWVSEG